MTASAGPALRRLHRDYGGRVRFVTLYVREAHPGERYPQPATLERKIRHARDYAARDGIEWTVAVDELDGRLHRALDEKPSSAYFMDPSGRVVFRTLWSNDASTFRAGLEAALHGQPPEDAEREPKVAPMLGGLGAMDEILAASGETARRDVYAILPPLGPLARLARAFRPLPPLGRGIVAVALAAVAALGLGILVARWSRAA